MVHLKLTLLKFYRMLYFESNAQFSVLCLYRIFLIKVVHASETDTRLLNVPSLKPFEISIVSF
jgi:hypothetical protein